MAYTLLMFIPMYIMYIIPIYDFKHGQWTFSFDFYIALSPFIPGMGSDHSH